MKIALGQMEVIPNQPQRNVNAMLRMMDRARKQGVHLIAFPEMCVAGYFLSDKWLIDDFCLDLMAHNEILLKESEGIALAFGNVYLDKEIQRRTGSPSAHPNQDGRTRRYNAVYVMQDGCYACRVKKVPILPSGVQPKVLLPNYRIFDDQRYFFSAKDIAADFDVSLQDLLQPFVIRAEEKEEFVGFELCEDLWCNDYRKSGESLNATKILIQNGARSIVNLSASPWTYGKNDARDKRVLFLRQDCGKDFVPFFYVNCVGVQNNGKNIATYDGGSTVYNRQGKPFLLSTRPYEEELLMAETGENSSRIVCREKPDKIRQKREAILHAIRHFKVFLGKKDPPRFFLGLSGGVDSALAAVLLVEAVGPDKVFAINMPTQYNQDITRKAAAHVAEKLGIHYTILPIHPLVEAHVERLDLLDLDDSQRRLSAFHLENIQAKIRGTSILSNLAAKYGGIFVNTGNKLEIALGYSTLYGDTGGAFCVLGDLTKVEVFAMARYLNETVWKEEVIPKELFPDEMYRFPVGSIPPSAELRDDQIDPMKFGYHDALLEAFTDHDKKTPEDILRWYLENRLAENLGLDEALLDRWGLKDARTFVDDLEWFCRSMDNNVFKRIQSPPIIITSRSAFGFDIRESLLSYRPSTVHIELRSILLDGKSLTRQKGE